MFYILQLFYFGRLLDQLGLGRDSAKILYRAGDMRMICQRFAEVADPANFHRSARKRRGSLCRKVDSRWRQPAQSKPLFAGLLVAMAVAGPEKRVVLILDVAGFHTRPNLALPDGIRLVYLPPSSLELRLVETLWPPGERTYRQQARAQPGRARAHHRKTSGDLAERQTDITSCTNFA